MAPVAMGAVYLALIKPQSIALTFADVASPS